MQSNCPDCGDELQDIARQLKQDPNIGNDEVDLFNQVVGYYCGTCEDFYSIDELEGSYLK